jgi:hypothetical protein
MDIESTPAMARKVYETMAKNLKVVRRRLGKPLTLADKVLLGHLDDPESQDMVPGKRATSSCGPTAWYSRMCSARPGCCSSCRRGARRSRSRPRCTAIT